MRDERWRNLYELSEAERRFLMRTDWGFVHQTRPTVRMAVSAGANVGERMMAVGDRHYGRIRQTAIDWLAASRSRPIASTTSRAQLFGRHAAAPADRPQPRHQSAPRLHGRTDRGLDVSCRRACSTCCAGWCPTSALAAIVVTHDLAVARPPQSPHDGDEGRPASSNPASPTASSTTREPYTQLPCLRSCRSRSEVPLIRRYRATFSPRGRRDPMRYCGSIAFSPSGGRVPKGG